MILVTGASGFLGQHLVKALSQQGKKVRALYKNNPPNDFLKTLAGVEWIPCDLLDVFEVEKVLEEITEVYHCAAIVSFAPQDKERMLHFNVESTANLVNESIQRNIRKFLFVSSVAALGRHSRQNLITEEEPWEDSKYNSQYAQSKHLAEMEIWRGVGEGLNAVIANPGLIVGEPLDNNWNNGTCRFMKTVSREFPFYTDGVNAWTDVQDLVKIMILLMNSEIHSERFIVSGGNYSYREIFGAMAKHLNKKPPTFRTGKILSGVVWRWYALQTLFSGGRPLITKETARNAQKKTLYDNRKILNAFPGFAYTSIENTISRMAQSFISNNQ